MRWERSPPASTSSPRRPSTRRNSNRSSTTTTRFAKNTEQKTGNRLDPHALLPDSDAQKYLQAYYSAPVGSANNAIDLDDARDGSAWTAANARYNDFFREIVNRFGFDDALLLDGRGNVVYSADKGVDLGTNILTGPYRESNLRDAYEQTIASNAVDFVARHRLPALPAGRGCPNGLDGRAGRGRTGASTAHWPCSSRSPD